MKRSPGLQNAFKEHNRTTTGLRLDGKALIPDAADGLKLEFLRVAHVGQDGHQGADATVASLRENFIWNGISTDTNDFVANCPQCVLAQGGSQIPRPLSPTLHPARPNEVLHFDFVFLGEGEDDKKYSLVIKEDFSGYAWLSATTSAPASHAAKIMSRWRRTSTVPLY